MSFSNVATASNAIPAAQFDFSGDVQTTFDFGECQPTHVKLCPTAGKQKIKTDCLVRLSPLVSPAFGRLRFHQYHQFVPFSDIFPAYGEFLANVERLNDPNSTTLSKYDTIPHIPSNLLLIALLHKKIGRMKNQVASRNPYTTSGTNPDDPTTPWTPKNTAAIDQGLASMIPHVTTMFDTTQIIDTFIQSSNMAWNPETSDIIGYLPRGYQAPSATSALTADRLWAMKHSRRSLRLYKIFVACGMKPTFKADFQYSALPLLAFYKAWWDIMRLPQYDNIQSTNYWRLVKFYEVNGSVEIDFTNFTQKSKDLLDLWFAFLEDLCECFYTSNADFVSAHEPIAGTGIQGGNSSGQYDLTGATSANNAYLGSGSDFHNINTDMLSGVHRMDMSTGAAGWSHLDIDYLMKCYYWCNQKSQIGYDLAEIIKAKGYESRLKRCKSCYIGSTSMPIQVSEVISTADTNTRDLGDYAGQASKAEGGKTFKYYNDETGYLVSFACILPDLQTTMALDPTVLGISNGGNGATNLYPFYNPMTEGLGRVASPKAVVGYENVVDTCADRSQSTARFNASYMDDTATFGLCPQFMGFKVGQNIRNGLMALNSQRNTFAPWTMDRMTLQNGFKVTGTYSPTSFCFDVCNYAAHKHQIPVAGKVWRQLVAYPGLTNYRRIFYDYTYDDAGEIYNPLVGDPSRNNPDNEYAGGDDFMCVIHYTHISTQNMLPVSRTWDTMDEEQERTGRGTFNVKK